MDTEPVMMAAACFIGCGAPNHDEGRIRRRRLAIDQPLRAAGLPRAATRVLAGCLQFCEPVRVGGQQRHGPEGPGKEVQVEARDDHVSTTIGQLRDEAHDVGPEELRLVDADHPGVVSQLILECPNVRYRDCRETNLAVGGNGLEGITVVEGRLERLDRRTGVARLIEPADQFLRLAAEHATADQVKAPGWLVEPDLLEADRAGFRCVMTPADWQKALGRAIDWMEPLRAAGQVSTTGLRADAVIELEGKISRAHQLRQRAGRLAGVVELPTGHHDVDPMNRRQVVENLHQPVVVPLPVVDGDELRRGIELVQQLVGIRWTLEPLTPAALALSPLGLGLELLGLAGMGRPGECAQTAEAAALAVLAVALVDHGLSFAGLRSGGTLPSPARPGWDWPADPRRSSPAPWRRRSWPGSRAATRRLAERPASGPPPRATRSRRWDGGPAPRG